MNIDQAYKSIRDKYVADVETAMGLTTQYENMPFTRPEDTMYAKFTIIPGGTQQQSLGAPTKRFRSTGLLIVSVFVPLETGDQDVVQKCDAIALSFASKTYQSVVFNTPSVIRVGRVDKWWQYNVSCPWYLDKLA